MAASLASGIPSIVGDLRVAFRDAGPSVFTPGDRRQIEAVRASVPPGTSLLLVANSDDAWHARLWQRGLYPERALIVRYVPLDSSELRRFRTQYAIRFAIALGDPPPDPGFRWRKDLGTLPGRGSHLWFGELEP